MVKRIRKPKKALMSRRRMLTLSSGFGIGAFGLALVGCGGGSDESSSASTNQQSAGRNESPPAPADLEETPELPPAAAVGSGSSVVNVTQNPDFSISLDPESVPSGEVTFNIQNDHPLAHAFVVMRSNLETFDLTLREFTLDPDQPGVEFVGQLGQEENPPRESASLTVSLSPGRHIVSCTVDSHYQQFNEVVVLEVT